MGILKVFFNNTRKPEGLLGRCMVGSMNHAHAASADWGLSYLPETGLNEIAELGCGGGGISEPFCENTLPRLSPPWTTPKYP